MDAWQPAGWTTGSPPVFLGEDEPHQLHRDWGVVVGAVDDGVEHRRVVGLYPPGALL